MGVIFNAFFGSSRPTGDIQKRHPTPVLLRGHAAIDMKRTHQMRLRLTQSFANYINYTQLARN
jgi:hypothetical protein